MNALEDYPFLREIRSPVTAEQLRALDPRCRVVQYSSPLKAMEFKKVATFLKQYPRVQLRIYGHHDVPCDLNFLRGFPFVRRLAVDVFDLQDFTGIAHVSPDLEELTLGQTKVRCLSLRFLERFQNLRTLSLEAHTKDIDVVGTLRRLEELALRAITLPNLAILKPLKSLRSLEIKLGGTKNLAMLPETGKLRYLHLCMIRGLCDVSPVARLPDLRFLFLEALKNVTALPSFARLRALRRVQLVAMKGIQDLQAVAKAPGLEDLVAADMRHLKPEAFRPFMEHPTLKRVLAGLGSDRKNKAVDKLLGLPEADLEFV
jgi:internalin A